MLNCIVVHARANAVVLRDDDIREELTRELTGDRGMSKYGLHARRFLVGFVQRKVALPLVAQARRHRLLTQPELLSQGT